MSERLIKNERSKTFWVSKRRIPVGRSEICKGEKKDEGFRWQNPENWERLPTSQFI